MVAKSSLPPARPITRFGDTMPLPAPGDHPHPALSVIVVAYDMPEQLNRTLHSLSLDYQQGVEEGDYEVIVVENHSANALGESRATAHRGSFRYFLRDEDRPTPIFAVNFGVSQARAERVAIMIDGARMVSPGIIAWNLAATRLHENAVVCVPGYHLGSELQQLAAAKGYDESAESRLLESINWPEDGYRLFEICCSAGTSAGGFFKPIGESNCIALNRVLFDELGGFDEGFRQRGGGLVNLDFYKRVLEHPDSRLVILPGEGSFHQYHGGETTGRRDVDREGLIHDMAAEYLELRGERYSPPERRAVYLGPIPDHALRFIRHGAAVVIGLNGLPEVTARRPRLSVVVVGYRMPAQLERTLYTLSTRYQRNVSPDDYEVIVVENASDQNLDPDCLRGLEGNFRHILREEQGQSPVHALNVGLGLARGETVGVMIDGAHMLTPRVLEYALAAGRAYPNHLVGVPVYHLGHKQQHESVAEGFDEAEQDRLLDSVDWRADGYELLRISVWCNANRHGFLQPLMESNCYFAPRANLDKIGDGDTRFDLAGGGALNLHIFRALGLLPDTAYVVLHGEGSCHQFHGGVTSNTSREAVRHTFHDQLQDIWQQQFRALSRDPVYFGSISPQAQALLSEASKLAEIRFTRLAGAGRDAWPDQPVSRLEELPFVDPE